MNEPLTGRRPSKPTTVLAKGRFTIFQERPNVVSDGPLWVCFCEGYMYTAGTLKELLSVMGQEWKEDRHLVG